MADPSVARVREVEDDDNNSWDEEGALALVAPHGRSLRWVRWVRFVGTAPGAPAGRFIFPVEMA